MRHSLCFVSLLLGCSGLPNNDTGEDTDTDTDETQVPLEGQGSLSGDCGLIDETELLSPQPFYFSNSIDFGEAFDEEDLTEGGQEILTDGNLGGSSIWSEIISFEVLHRCDYASLLKTEAEIAYQDSGGKKTDLLVSLDGVTTGVSVTRAFGWPPEDPYTLEQATELLEKKLGDIPLSTANVAQPDIWTKQILHILAYTADHAATIEQAWNTLQDTLKLDTIVVVTTTEGDDEIMY